MTLLRKLLSGTFAAQTAADDQAVELYREIIRREAKIGGQLFGPVPAKVRREFFCLDTNTWVWHEEWVDTMGVHRSVTTRYDVRPNGVLKAQGGQPYQHISLDEARRLYQAVSLYNKKIDAELYALAA